MRFKLSYNKRWLFYTLSFFLIFSGVLLISEYYHEKKIRIEALNEELSNYTGIADRYAASAGIYRTGYYRGMDSLMDLIPDKSLRITIIANDGKVLFDSEVDDPETMENHGQRPEVLKASVTRYGTDIRVSATTNTKYYYFAKKYNNNVIRASVIYDIDAERFLKPDRLFLVFITLILFITALAILLVTDKFGKSVSTLREFTLKALANKPIDGDLGFPENELGLIGQDIIDIYRNLNKTKEELLAERSKLIRHLNMIDEGIAIFSKDKTIITNNNHFIQYINHISDKRLTSAGDFFAIDLFAPIFTFIRKYVDDEAADLSNFQPTYELTLHVSGKYYSLRSTVFQDKTFEVSIDDITKPAKRKLMKQQMTENIAHELKTPVSSIKGFLETILTNDPDRDKTQEFLRRAYSQASRLADLINDISLLTKIEEAGNLYEIEEVNINELIADIADEIQPRLDENNIGIEITLAENMNLNGNPVLLYSIFINLFDNAISHAGNNIKVKLDNYMEDTKYYYFSFSDTGTGAPAEDLPRLFERFYRVDKGRDRKKGGTGLGLAIVKNAVQFHRGDISVKNRNGGGLEFLFTLSKEM